MIKKLLKITFLTFLFPLLLLFSYFFIGEPPKAQKIIWGVNFSQKHTQNFGLDWKETYLALIEELGIKNIKIAVHWDFIESEKDEYNFEDLDWQIKTAEEKGVNLLLVIGMKTPRWPECHVPGWAKDLTKEEQQERISKLIESIILRYRGQTSIWAWQVENEPFFPFGNCPWVDEEFVKKEVALVKSLDSLKRPVIISDSGEGSFWIKAAKLGDIVGTTLYRKVWFSQLNIYINYFFPPNFYWQKAQYIKRMFNKKVIVVELQTEPWGPKLLYDSPLEEQEKTMDLEQFRKNIDFAKKTGLGEFYLWGAEWWFWMKEIQGDPKIWEEARNLFREAENP